MTKFEEKIRKTLGPAGLRALRVEVLQVNVGYRCNMACKHCHIGASPSRTEMMDEATVEAVLRALEHPEVKILDITGGAPELNPYVTRLISGARALEKRVMLRSNLTVFLEDGLSALPAFYAEHDVEVIASLPYYLEDSVDRVRGEGSFQKSIEALRRLNGLGYGTGRHRLDLVYNPQGPFLPLAQDSLEEEYRRELDRRFDITFDSLFSFTNMPLGRFGQFLDRTGQRTRYMERLEGAFNPATLDGIMCRLLVNVGWDGRLYDCDFNQVLGLSVTGSSPAHIDAFDCRGLAAREIAVGDHCFGCTAGAGST